MEKIKMTKWVVAICSVFLIAGLLSTLAMADETEAVEYDMYVQPYMISLNANSNSNAEFITTVSFACHLYGQKITESEVDFVIGEDVVTNAISMRVTREGVCQAYFNKADIQEYALGKGLTEEVIVTVRGNYTHEPISGGNSGTRRFTGEGRVFFR